MELSSSTYFVFLAGVFALYWILYRVRLAAIGVILFANYFFYARWDLTYLVLIPAASTIDFLIGLGLQDARRPWIRRFLVTASIAMNVGILATFKYTPFFIENLTAITQRPAALEWSWVLPVTLSFYVFQSLTYTIDLYRRDIKGTRSLLEYLAAVSFFPTTLAGPITRVSTLLKQFTEPRTLDAARGGRGLFLIGMGLTKKLMIADFLGSNLVDRVFDFPTLYSGAETLVAVYAYALQLYYDFSGYTDIALGSALLIGITLPINFNQPYAARNIADFWRRWHISLSNWLRDYLYFSLPGKRIKIFTYGNLFLTMVIGGLWHGPAWTFVVWGALHGAALVVVRLWQTLRGRVANEEGAWAQLRQFASIVVTFNFVCFAWIFFRAESVERAGEIIQRILSGTTSLQNIPESLWLMVGIGAVAHYIPKRWYDFSLDLYIRAPFYAQAVAMAALVTGLQYVERTGAVPFIYNRF